MGEASTFIEQNKNAVIEEMGQSVNNLNQILNSIVETPDDDSGELAVKKLLMLLGHQVGAVTMLFNEFYILYTGIIPSEQEERKIGFVGMHQEDQKRKKKKKEDE